MQSRGHGFSSSVSPNIGSTPQSLHLSPLSGLSIVPPPHSTSANSHSPATAVGSAGVTDLLFGGFSRFARNSNGVATTAAAAAAPDSHRASVSHDGVPFPTATQRRTSQRFDAGLMSATLDRNTSYNSNSNSHSVPATATAAAAGAVTQASIVSTPLRMMNSISSRGLPATSSGSGHRQSVAMRRRQSYLQAGAASTNLGAPPHANSGGGGSSTSVYSIQIECDDGGIEMRAAQSHILNAIRLRSEFKCLDKGQLEGSERVQAPITLHLEDGIFSFSNQHTRVVPWEAFYDHVQSVYACTQHPPCQAACRYRLQILEERYNIYKLCNGEMEENADRYRRGGGVFANCWRVDNCVQLETMMNAQALVEYVQEAIETHGEDPVVTVTDAMGNKEPRTLTRACELLDFAEPYLLTADGLGLEISSEKPLAFFDVLDPDFNRGGRNSAELLRMFLTRDTLNNGEFFADAVRPVLERNELRTRCPQATEATVEITGMVPDEWEATAEWVREHGLDRFRTNRWCIAFPRRKMRPSSGGAKTGGEGGTAGSGNSSPNNSKNPNTNSGTNASGGGGKAGRLDGTNSARAEAAENMAHNNDNQLTFEDHQQHLDHLFLPLFHATLAPEDPKYADLAAFLSDVGSFSIVFSEEEERESAFLRKRRRPADVPWSERVCDLYFAYYVWANLSVLNAFRRRRGLNTFQLRAAAGGLLRSSASQNDAMVLSYLLCDSIFNGVALGSQPVLQYLYGIQGIGVCMSPLANNSVSGVPYVENPFQVLFRRGLRVSLATLSPLLFHHSSDALTEEYGTARRVYRLSGVDVCEIALNSVLISGFEDEVKARWLGEAFMRDGVQGNMYDISNVPTSRLDFRMNMWISEMEMLKVAAAAATIEEGANGTGNSSPVAISKGEHHHSHQSQQQQQQQQGISLPTIATPGVEEPSTLPSASGHAPGAVVTSTTAAMRAPYMALDPRVEFPRINIAGPYDRDVQHAAVAQLLHRALDLRHAYMRHLRRPTDRDGGGVGLGSEMNVLMQNPLHQIELAFRKDKNSAFHEEEWMFKTVEGIVVPHEVHQIPRLPQDMYHYEDFRAHVQELRNIVENLHVRNFATRRLHLLEHRFKLHVAVNHTREAGTTATKSSQNRDFYQSTKVDNTVRMESGMTARQLLNFIVAKAHNCADDIVSHQKGREPQTLRQLLSELNISADSLTVDDLDVQVDTTLGGVASQQYTPEGRDELLTLLLKTDNQMNGRYFAELTKLTFDNLKRDNFTFSENRLPIYGASNKEWALLSSWFDTHGMASSHNRWMVQVPRIYGYLRKQGKVQNFAEYLENIFKPLWNVSLHPTKEPRLFHFVNHITGFDCVEYEGRPDVPLGMATKPPHEWVSEEDPPYNYYMYHMWANIYSLNEFRRRRQFTSFTFRPSCGETGQLDHLIGGFLLANSVSYGVQLGDDGPMQYLFYLAQIGVTVCPLSNNTKVLSYLDNPFPKFFRRGLMVSLGTDGPLMYHHTQEPLIEEYSIASKVWKLSSNDMCEIARSSVLLSGFGPAFKRDRLGDLFFLSSSASNDGSRTHLSDIRVAFRFETYHNEVGFLEYVAGLSFHRALLTLPEEEQREKDFTESVRNHHQQQRGPAQGGIIESIPDKEDLEKLETQRSMMQGQLEHLTTTLSELQRQNRQLTEKLAEERDKDRQAAQYRRTKMEGRLDELGALHKLLVTVSQPQQQQQVNRDLNNINVGSTNAGDSAGTPLFNENISNEDWGSVLENYVTGAGAAVSNDNSEEAAMSLGAAAADANDGSIGNGGVAADGYSSAGAGQDDGTLVGNGSVAREAAAVAGSSSQQQNGALLGATESLWKKPSSASGGGGNKRGRIQGGTTVAATSGTSSASLPPAVPPSSSSGVLVNSSLPSLTNANSCSSVSPPVRLLTAGGVRPAQGEGRKGFATTMPPISRH